MSAVEQLWRYWCYKFCIYCLANTYSNEGFEGPVMLKPVLDID